MDVAKKILGAVLAVTGLVVAVHLMVTPLYHDGSPDYPVWEIMNWFMAVGVLVMLAVACLRKRTLVLQPQIVLGRMESLLGVVEVKWWQLSGTKCWKWPGGPKVLRKFMGALRSGFTVRNPAGGRWSI